MNPVIVASVRCKHLIASAVSMISITSKKWKKPLEIDEHSKVEQCGAIFIEKCNHGGENG